MENETRSSEVDFEREHQANQGFFEKFTRLPIVKKTLNDVYNLYTSVRERNILTKCSFFAAEAGTKMAFQTTVFAFEALPISIKTKIEKKGRSVLNPFISCANKNKTFTLPEFWPLIRVV